MQIDSKKMFKVMVTQCLSTRDLARKANVSPSTISKILYHGRKPNTATLGKLAKALDVSLETLIEQ